MELRRSNRRAGVRYGYARDLVKDKATSMCSHVGIKSQILQAVGVPWLLHLLMGFPK